MRTRKWAASILGVTCGLILHATVPAHADVASDRAAAILVFPKVVSSRLSIVSNEYPDQGADLVTDTIIQISNTSNAAVRLKCFYIDATSRCSISGYACNPNSSSPCPEARDICLPRWVETDFRVLLTPQQPLAWTASHGLLNGDAPIDGVLRRGIGGASNAGTDVPPVPRLPADPEVFSTPNLEVAGAETFVGELKCIVVDGTDRAIPSNVIKGEATIVGAQTQRLFEAGFSASLAPTRQDMQDVFDAETTEVLDIQLPSVEKYSALGIQAIEGDANGDDVLELGGGANEYNGCPSVLIVDHFFDFATNPASGHEETSELTLVPCQQDLVRQKPGSTTAQYLVFNEFEQRFSTSRAVECVFASPLGLIDTRDPQRSIFSVFVAGTLTGQTRIRGVSGGLLGLLRQREQVYLTIGVDGSFTSISAPTVSSANVQQQGVREAGDQIVLP